MFYNKGCNKVYLFLSPVKDQTQYSISYLDKNKKIIEKPKNSKSNLVASGLYIFQKTSSKK